VRPHLEFSTQAWAPWTEHKQVLPGKNSTASSENGVWSCRKTFEERSAELGLEILEERRHQADMALVHKIMQGKGQLDHSCWFEKAADGQRATRKIRRTLSNLRDHGRLEIRWNFFRVRD
jgi:hypothetical protein